MIDREQVLHVARLARLELSDDEVDARWRRELSTILDHIEKIAELDLDGRAADDARRRGRQARCAPTSRGPWLPREVALAKAPAVAGRRLPRPEPAGAA